MKNNFVIAVNGMAPGENTFLGIADKEFFVKFENCEVQAAELKIAIVADRQSDHIDFECTISGTITVPCDRCLKPVAMPVSTSCMLRLNRGCDSPLPDDSYEEVFLPEGSDELDLNQEVYDYSLLALPLQRFHKEGECDPAALECLSNGSDEPAGLTDSPFSDLAEILKSNK